MSVRKPWWRRMLCVLGSHVWRTYEEATALNTNECCKHCVGWRFYPSAQRGPRS